MGREAMEEQGNGNSLDAEFAEEKRKGRRVEQATAKGFNAEGAEVSRRA